MRRDGGFSIKQALTTVAAAMVAVLVASAPASAQAQSSQVQTSQIQISQIQSAAEAQRRAKEAAAAAQAAHDQSRQLAAERRTLDEELAALGPRIVEREMALNVARDRLNELRDDVSAAEARLSAATKRLRRLLVAAQLAAREPTPSLLVHPDRPLDAARSAILLRRLAIELRRTNEAAQTERDRIAAARLDAERVMNEARRDLFAVQEDEARVETLLRRKEEAIARFDGEAVEAEAQAQRFRDEATSLTELAAAIRRAPEPPSRAPTQPEPPRQLPDQTTALPRSDPPRGGQNRRFVESRGAVLRPVAGRIATGADLGPYDDGKRRPGVTFVTEPYARVISPWDGTVRYSGPFPGYGHIVIIEPQNDYQLLLTGLASVDREKNDRVLAGEPVGRMGGPPPSSSEFLFEVSATARPAQERLYFEIRKGGDVIDPTPWLTPEAL